MNSETAGSGRAAFDVPPPGGQLSHKNEILAHYATGTLPELFVERMHFHLSDEMNAAFYTAIAQLHNDGTIDALEPARTITASSIDQHKFFTVMHIYCDLIPALEAEVPAMLAAVKALVARAGDDLASGMPTSAYLKWAEQGKRALATLAAINPADPEDAAYVFLGLQALAKTEPATALDAAIGYLTGTAPPARSAAAKAVGSVEVPTSAARARAGAALAAACRDADDNTLGHSLTAICEIARAHSEMEAAAIALINAAIPNVGEKAIHQLSLELMFHGEKLPPSIVSALSSIMQKVAIGNRVTLRNIDEAGRKLLVAGRLDEGLALITPLISNHGPLTSLETLERFAHALLQLAPSQLAKVVTGWLLSLDANLGHATKSLVGEYHGDAPLLLEADSMALGLSGADAILLAYRAIGYLFVHPITAASLVLGLVRGADDASRSAIEEILFDPLLISYSGELADWLRKQVEDSADPAQPVIIGLLARLEAYIGGLRKAGQIKELGPSERERLIENHRGCESMRRAHKQAEKKSLLMSIVSRSVMLYGNRSISYFEGSDGKAHRNEMKLQSFRHSFEMPRIDVLEPFDLDYKLRTFRAMRVTGR